VDVFVVLERRDARTGEWQQDGPVERFEDDGVWRGHIRARRLGEWWVGEAPEQHRCVVWPQA
jgi:hypothetical protein